MVYVRRLVSRVVTPAGVGAAVAALVVAYAFAQPAARPATSPRPAFEDAEDVPLRGLPQRAVRRRDTRPAGELPDFDNPEGNQPQSYGNPPGFGAGRSGFVSTNKRRPPTGLRKGLRPQAKQNSAQAAPLSLAPPGMSATAGLPGT